MKRVLFFCVILFAILFSAACQDYYSSPQDVVWNHDEEIVPDGSEVFNVALLKTDADPEDELSYISVSTEGGALEEHIDLAAHGLSGIYIVCVRYVWTVDEETLYGDWAYANVEADTQPDGPFYIYRFGKPGGLRVVE